VQAAPPNVVSKAATTVVVQKRDAPAAFSDGQVASKQAKVVVGQRSAIEIQRVLKTDENWKAALAKFHGKHPRLQPKPKEGWWVQVAFP
jgi:hypothetical protein